MKTKFYPTITTLSNSHFDKIVEAENLDLKKLCVFFTKLDPEERKIFFKELDKSNIQEIPFAHIRGDFREDEINFLKKRFKTKYFNIHSEEQHPILYDYGPLKKQIFIENTMYKFRDNEINDYAGMCLDVSHLENDRLTKSWAYPYFSELLKSMGSKCGHASAIGKYREYCPVAESKRYDNHFFKNNQDFDYLLRYKNILPEIVALEVENSLEEQVEAIKYINKLLNL